MRQQSEVPFHVNPNTAAERELFMKSIEIQDAAGKRRVKPQEWSVSTVLMWVEVYLSLLGWAQLEAFTRAAYWLLHLDPARHAGDHGAWATALVIGSAMASPALLECPAVLSAIKTASHRPAIGVVICFALSVIPNNIITESGAALGIVRVAILWFATSLHLFGQAAVLSIPIADSPRPGRAPWALTQGLLLLQCIRYGTGSAGLIEGTSPTGLASKIVCSVLGLIAVLILTKESGQVTRSHEQDATATAATHGAQDDNPTAVQQPQSCAKVWLAAVLIGIQLGANWALSLWLFSSPVSLPYFVGQPPIRHSTALVILLLAIGIAVPIAGVLQRLLMYSWASLLLLGGMALLLHLPDGSDGAFVGGLMVALALPAMWCLTLSSIRRVAVQGAVGRLFALGGVTTALLIWGYAGAISERGPLRADGLLCSDMVGFGWFLSGSWWLPISLEYMCYRTKLLRMDVGKCNTWKLFHEKKNSVAAAIVLAFVAGIVFAVVLVVAASQMAVQFGVAEEALARSGEFTVATVNAQQGFDSFGRTNHDCLRAILGDLASPARPMSANLTSTNVTASSTTLAAVPMIVGLQESNGLHWLAAGVTDPPGFLARQLGMFAYYGPAGREGSLGVALLSRLRLRAGSDVVIKLRGDDAENKCTPHHFVVQAVVETDAHLPRGIHVWNVLLGTVAGDDRKLIVSRLATLAVGVVGPVVILGDFALHPDGSSPADGTSNQSVWQPLLDAGFTSVTPLSSSYETTTQGTLAGQQQDFIWYRGLALKYDSVQIDAGWCIREARPQDVLSRVCTGEVVWPNASNMCTADCRGQGAGQASGTVGAHIFEELYRSTDSTCSDHRPIVASFELDSVPSEGWA
eukprot:SAG31_NODE_759_length_12288_cov_5.890475_9_plen_861_part_00